MKKILLVDDDQELCRLLKEYLQSEGFSVAMAHDGKAGVEAALTGSFDAVVLDVMMPVIDGLEALRQIQAQSKLPVLMLTAKGETTDRITGLELGADDYLPKPCHPRELIARLRSILRRTQIEELEPAAEELHVEDLYLQSKRHTVTWKEQPVTLTGAEFTVLELLMRSAGEVISKESLTEKALGRKLTPYDRSIDVHVSNIRKKLHKLGAPKELIINIRGSGYMLTYQG